MSERSATPRFDPHTFAFPHSGGPTSADRKAPPASTLYPELADYCRVDVDRYVSREYLRLEWDRLWSRTWTLAGRESDIPGPGSYFRYDLGQESFIVVRGRDNVVRAFYNVCQHRGRRLIDDDFGTRVRFVCPFHSWTYDLDGENKRITDRELFSKPALCGDLNLKQARCETWAGFVFINMDPAAEPLANYLGEIPGLMSAYKMQDMHVVKETVVTIDCNWKIGLEAFIESYHLHVTHPQALPLVDDLYEQYDVYANGHARLATPLGIRSPRMAPAEQLSDELAFFLTDAGIDPKTYTGPVTSVREAIWKAKRAPGNRYGLDYSAFTDSQLTDDWNYFIYPNTTFNTHPEGVSIMRFLPHPADPEKFIYHVQIIVPKMGPGVRPPFYMGVDDDADVSGKTRPRKECTTMEKPNLGVVFEQDISNMCATQRGLHSRGLPGGMRYAERELRIQVFHAETERRLRGRK